MDRPSTSHRAPPKHTPPATNSAPESPEDEAYVDALEEAIIEKENENPTGFFPDVDQQWEQFVTHYLPDQKDTL